MPDIEALLNTLDIQSVQSMENIDAIQWNAMVENDYPFIKHEYLLALEQNQCVGETFGWFSRHLLIYDKQTLIAAMPLYEKTNNYGEFVFDQPWEEAWQQAGLDYYPKLVSAMPYTPALGPRFLTQPSVEYSANTLQKLLLHAAQSICHQLELSGFHILFAEPKQQTWLEEQVDQDLLFRHDCQFHWQNQHYDKFEDFLEKLTPKKRKNIRQERRFIEKQDINFRILDGKTASKEDWQHMANLYSKTFNEKWGTPTLNLAFFLQIAKTLPQNIVLVLAEQDEQCIAGSLMFKSDTHLYGRFWGCFEEVKHLHFEACYYQGIEYAIQHNLAIFEPGAGGEHKIARGFSPVEMHSTHWLRHNPFPEGIQQFLKQEQQDVASYVESCNQHLPYLGSNTKTKETT